MKKKNIIIIVSILVLIILLVPIKFQYKDGGTIEYRSLIYKIIKWHRLDEYYENGLKIGTEIHFFPNNLKPIDYFDEVKPPRFSLIYIDELFYSQVLSYCWKNEYNSVCADTLGPTDINYKEVINVNKNDEFHYGTFIPITSIKLYDENGIFDYDIEFSNDDEIIRVPDISGVYFLQIYYKSLEGNVSYAFKININ